MKKGRGSEAKLGMLLNISFLCLDWIDQVCDLASCESGPMNDTTLSQLKCGGIIQRHPDGIRMKAIATLMHVTPGAATQMVETFVKAGLAERFTNPDDRRAVYVRMSKRGAAFAQSRYALFQKAGEPLFKGITKENQNIFLDVLGRISDRLLTDLDSAANQ
jgi:DNA-binding MarR family transcriptional regulator